ncbi:MAG: polysaccharide export protein [Pseudomonadota bacterium]|nr:polysaccharide export protein [Pseudomonadota bacterium]
MFQFLVRVSFLFICAFGISGCTALPSAGPEIDSASYAAVNPQKGAPHAVVNVTPEVIRVVEKSQPESGLGSFRGPGAASIRIGIGDVVGVTIFEASPGGLFIPLESTNSSGNFVNLPDQKVDSAGNISVPYAGSIKAAGQEPAAVQRVIEQRLASRAIEPQAVVAVKSQTSSEVSVLGDVNAPSKFPINADGERILDVIAKAGGPKQPGYETYVTLQRGKKKATIYFQKLVREPSNNIHVLPNDTIYVYREAHAFTAFGASGENGRFDFAEETISLSDALGKAGGLLDNRANPGAVMVYRTEDRKTAAKLGVPVEKFGDDHIPVIYQFNLRDPGGFFLASSFPVHNKDVIYIGNAAIVRFMKFIDVVGATTSAASAGRNAVD